MLSLVRKWCWGLFLEEMEEKVEKSASPDGVSFRVVKFEDLNSSEDWKMARFHNHSGHAYTRRYSKVDNLSMCFDFRGTIVSFLWDFWATWSKEVPVLCELANNVVNLCTNNIYTSMFYKALNKMFERNLVPSQQIIFSLKLFYLFIYPSILKGRQRWIHRVRSTIYSCTSPKCQKKKKSRLGKVKVTCLEVSSDFPHGDKHIVTWASICHTSVCTGRKLESEAELVLNPKYSNTRCGHPTLAATPNTCHTFIFQVSMFHSIIIQNGN